MTDSKQPCSDGPSTQQNFTKNVRTKSMKLIANAGQWYKMHSQRASLAIMGISGSLLMLPPETQTRPILALGSVTVQDILVWCTLVSAFLGFIGRMLVQDTVDK